MEMYIRQGNSSFPPDRNSKRHNREKDNVLPCGASFSRTVSLLLALVLLFCGIPAASFADDMQYYEISKVLLQSYPGSGGCDLPVVGQDYSAFYVQSATSGVTVNGWSLTDDSGNQCSDKVEEKSYTLSVSVSSQAVNMYFSGNTVGTINGEAAVVTASGDGLSAVISRQIYPRLIAPTVWKNPGDETHDAGEVFSFAASASPYYTTVQWYVRSPYNETYKAEEIHNVFPDVACSVYDHGSSGSTLNLSNVPAEMNEWMVYCAFIGAGGETDTSNAVIHVNNAASAITVVEPSAAPVPTSTVVPIVTSTPQITIVETPTPTSNVWIVEEDWSEDWSYDKTYHWHDSNIPQVTDVNEKAEHTLVWTETRAATKKEDGEKTGVCSVCGYTETQPVVYVRPTRTSLNLPSSIKWIIGIVFALLLLTLIILIVHYLKVKARKKRRARMAGRGRSYRR